MNTSDQLPLVSVVIQTYNHDKYIAECLDSILAQDTIFPYEIIIGEDESTDTTRAICKKYAAEHPDIIRLFQRSEKDKIYIRGKKTGRFNWISNVKASRGKYIAVCEGDDFWTDTKKLQKQFDFMEVNPDYSICFHNAVVKDERDILVKKKFFKNSKTYKDTYTIEDTFGEWFIPTASLFFVNHPDFEFPEWYSKVTSGDLSLICLMAQFGKIKYLDENMCCYRKNPGGISYAKFKKSDWIVWWIRDHIYLLECLDQHFEGKYKELINEHVERLMGLYAATVGVKKPFSIFKLGYDKLAQHYSIYEKN